MKALTFLLALIFSAAISNARPGESQQECERRYGEFKKIERPFSGQDVFKTRIEREDGTRAIVLWFIDGRREGIEYACLGIWTDEEIEDLYKKNFGSKKYKKVGFTRLVEDGGYMLPKGDDGLPIRTVEGGDNVAFYSKKLMEVKGKEWQRTKPAAEERTKDL